jgi:hypothetical protein
MASYSELKGVVEEKAPSWVKHAIRRWKQFYNEIQFVDGQIDTSNPLSTIFRNEALMTKIVTEAEGSTISSHEPDSSKKEESTHTQPSKSPPSKQEKKQCKGRFIYKIKKPQVLLNPGNFWFSQH